MRNGTGPGRAGHMHPSVTGTVGGGEAIASRVQAWDRDGSPGFIPPAARPRRVARSASGVAVRRPDLLDLSDAQLAGLLDEPGQCADAREALVHRYEPVVQATAREYRPPAQYHEDLLQVGYLGLLKAVSNFDPSVHEDLGASPRLRDGEIERFLRDKRRVTG